MLSLNGQEAGCYTASWAPDGSVLAISEENEGLEIWHTNGQASLKPLTDIVPDPPRWSPDSKRMVVFQTVPGGDRYEFYMAFPDERPLRDLGYPINNIHWEPSDAQWLDNTILVSFEGCGYQCGVENYIDTDSGTAIASWVSFYSATQTRLVSPDKRWLLTDNAGEKPGHEYDLYDFDRRQSRELAAGSNVYLQFVGWSMDSRSAYLVSRPVSGNSTADSKLPWGLLRLEPETGTLTPVFEQAVFADWSPNQDLMWVAFPSKATDGSQELTAGLYQLSTATLIGRTTVSATVPYQDPSAGPLLATFWSHSGGQVVVVDGFGRLRLMTADGAVRDLASQAPADSTGDAIQVLWSPDDRHLLVGNLYQAWIVPVL